MKGIVIAGGAETRLRSLTRLLQAPSVLIQFGAISFADPE